MAQFDPDMFTSCPEKKKKINHYLTKTSKSRSMNSPTALFGVCLHFDAR